MNADSDNGGVNKNKSQANLMKGVSEGGAMLNLKLWPPKGFCIVYQFLIFFLMSQSTKI